MSLQITGNGSKSAIHATSVLRTSVASHNCSDERLLGGLTSVPGLRTYGVEEDVVSRLTGMIPAAAGGTQSAPGDDDPCPEHCWGGNI